MKKIFAILLPAVALCFASCDGDLLNKTPESTISPDSYFKTEADLKLFSNAFYSQFDDSFYEDQSDHFINLNLSNELRGGNVRTVPSTGGGWSWTMLRRINELLRNIDKCQDEKVRAEYAGLAKFFRAFFYFEKVKKYGDVLIDSSSLAVFRKYIVFCGHCNAVNCHTNICCKECNYPLIPNCTKCGIYSIEEGQYTFANDKTCSHFERESSSHTSFPRKLMRQHYRKTARDLHAQYQKSPKAATNGL